MLPHWNCTSACSTWSSPRTRLPKGCHSCSSWSLSCFWHSWPSHSSFTIYSAPLTDVISNHGVNTMGYANDTQLYLTLDFADKSGKMRQMENCLFDVKTWTAKNRLLLNDTKTEVVHMSSRFKTGSSSISSITVDQAHVNVVVEARNLGIVMDKHMTLTTHVNNIYRSACLTIHKVGQT